MPKVQEFDNVLYESENRVNVLHKLKTLKLDYLVIEKQKLQVELSEMSENNQLIRNINKQISNSSGTDLKELIKRLQLLERQYLKVSQENKKLRADIFLAHQIGIESQKQQQEIVKWYENKILELRKMMQSKQFYIQLLQQELQLKKGTPVFTVSPQNLVIQYCQQIHDLKKINQDLKKGIKKSQAEKMQLREENAILTEQKNKVQFRINCKTEGDEIQNNVNQRGQKLNLKHFFNSNNQKDVIQYEKVANQNYKVDQNKILSSNTTRESELNQFKIIKKSSNLQLRKDNLNVRELVNSLQSKKIQIEQLQHGVKKFKQSNQKKSFTIKKLLQSRELESLAKKKIEVELKLKEEALACIFSILSKRKKLLPFFLSDKVQDLIRKIKIKKNVKQIKKHEWLQLNQNTVKKVPSTNKKIRKSYSCIIDYVCKQNQQTYENSVNQNPSNEDEQKYNTIDKIQTISFDDHQVSLIVSGNPQSNQHLASDKEVEEMLYQDDYF